RVDDYLYTPVPFPMLGDELVFVRGVLRFTFNNYRLEPRDALDLGTRERLAAITPALAYVPAGINGVPPGGLAVTLSRPASAPIVVNLSSSSMDVTVPMSVTVPVNAMSADVPLNVTMTASGRVTLMATYGMDTAMAQLVIYDDSLPRTIDTLAVTPSQLP